VFHQGYVESEERKAQLFSAADFFAFPTRADNLPLVIQEALACGCPVVTVPVGGVPEMVRHGVTGRVAADLSVAAFQHELDSMIDHAETAAAMRSAARAHAVAEWDKTRQAVRVAEVYARALGDFGMQR
jgi:glycosyltransferase involved in cell wall biosynthesis